MAREIQKQEESRIKQVFGSQKIRLYKIKHFIFDFGGVMIEQTFVIKNLIDIIESDLKITIPRSENSYYRKLFRQVGSGVISSRDFITKILGKYYYPIKKEKEGALPEKKVNVSYYLELWFQLYTKFARLSEDMREIVQNLHEAGYIVSLMSNTFDIHAKSNELKGFYEIFDNVFLSNEIGLRKPELEKYKYVLKKLKTKPKYCIFIDDKMANLIPARQLGIHVIKFESIQKFKEQLGDLGLKDISDVSRKDIKLQYKEYKLIKEEFRKAKKKYEKIKKEFLKTDKDTSQLKIDLQLKYDDYMIKKAEYKKAKLSKKELVSRIKVT
ncbi:MAG: HAD family hydrolase [Promethearchaeota archaeon]|nr:MAG: HAD family hydrolase [Candidatus Lokiarchaeota archaeon]